MTWLENAGREQNLCGTRAHLSMHVTCTGTHTQFKNKLALYKPVTRFMTGPLPFASTMAVSVSTRPATASGRCIRTHAGAVDSRFSALKSATNVVRDPLIVRAARGEKVERPPCWMMRQAGRYQKAYRDLAAKYPSFRQRSEEKDLIVEISLQPWKSFKPDGVILFSDILTPLSACGIPFEIDDNKGPLIDQPIREKSGLETLHPIELDRLTFVGESLSTLRDEVGPHGAAVLGFVGSPWTLATYVVEGKSTSIYKIIKTLMFSDPDTLDAILSHLTTSIIEYTRYQIDSGASYIQIFDSWGGQLPPHIWDQWSRRYIEKIVSAVKSTHPDTPIMLYANASGGLLERMGGVGTDVIGLDWTIDMADARKRLGADQVVQGNLDPAVLFADQDTIKTAVEDVLQKAGTQGHILNLGHGVLVGTPEENVKYVFDLSKESAY